MSNQTLSLTPELYQYLLRLSLRESPALRALREETAGHARAHMQLAPEQGQFMALLVRLLGARRCLELGVFTGYSALAIAEALPPQGELIACELNADYARTALHHWQVAGVEERIRLRLGPARDSLEELLAQGQAMSSTTSGPWRCCAPAACWRWTMRCGAGVSATKQNRTRTRGRSAPSTSRCPVTSGWISAWCPSGMVCCWRASVECRSYRRLRNTLDLRW